MRVTAPPSRADILVALGTAALVTVYAILILWIETENPAPVLVLIAAGAAAAVAARYFGLTARVGRVFAENERLMNGTAVVAVLAITAAFMSDHFPLLMIATVLLYLTACLGLTIQFGYTGVLNFAGAAFFGVGCYTAAVLTHHSPLPHLLILVIGGLMAAFIGSLLLLPVLRTRGHYAAVVTIAFGLLFKTFLEVNDTLGGAQGLRVKGMNLFGIAFNDNMEIAGIEISFYVKYVLLALALLCFAFTVTRRLERSWIGLNLDAVRLDETAAACFGINIPRWKITAFTVGNFLAGTSGALFAMMLGFIAPTNFTFGDSLILVSIIILGGLGNPWGAALATAIVIILPEKLQIIQEYRFLLYALTVILILRFRPAGLVPRAVRAYLPGWRPQ